MELRFVYELENELKRVKNLLEKKDFYIEHGYKASLPYGHALEDAEYNDVVESVEVEFGSDGVAYVQKLLRNKWDEHKAELTQLFTSIKPSIPNEILITLTQYGTSGSYKLPNEVILNASHSVPFTALIHEYIHNLIEEDIVQKSELNHSEKEGLVDWLFINNPTLKKLFPNYQAQKRSKLPTDYMIKRIGWDSLV